MRGTGEEKGRGSTKEKWSENAGRSEREGAIRVGVKRARQRREKRAQEKGERAAGRALKQQSSVC